MIYTIESKGFRPIVDVKVVSEYSDAFNINLEYTTLIDTGAEASYLTTRGMTKMLNNNDAKTFAKKDYLNNILSSKAIMANGMTTECYTLEGIYITIDFEPEPLSFEVELKTLNTNDKDIDIILGIDFLQQYSFLFSGGYISLLTTVH